MRAFLWEDKYVREFCESSEIVNRRFSQTPSILWTSSSLNSFPDHDKMFVLPFLNKHIHWSTTLSLIIVWSYNSTQFMIFYPWQVFDIRNLIFTHFKVKRGQHFGGFHSVSCVVRKVEESVCVSKWSRDHNFGLIFWNLVCRLSLKNKFG